MKNLLSIISNDFIVCTWLRKWIAGDKIGHDYDLYSDDAHPVTCMSVFYENRSFCKKDRAER